MKRGPWFVVRGGRVQWWERLDMASSRWVGRRIGGGRSEGEGASSHVAFGMILGCRPLEMLWKAGGV